MERSEYKLYFDPIINPQEIKSEEQEMVKQKKAGFDSCEKFSSFLENYLTLLKIKNIYSKTIYALK